MPAGTPCTTKVPSVRGTPTYLPPPRKTRQDVALIGSLAADEARGAVRAAPLRMRSARAEQGKPGAGAAGGGTGGAGGGGSGRGSHAAA